MFPQQFLSKTLSLNTLTLSSNTCPSVDESSAYVVSNVTPPVVCPINSGHCLPLHPLNHTKATMYVINNKNKSIFILLIFVMLFRLLSFSLVINYTADYNLDSCLTLAVQNEGMSVRGLVETEDLLIPLQFYYVSGVGINNNNNEGRYPKVFPISGSDTTIHLEYQYGNITTLFNASTIIGPYEYTLMINDARLLTNGVKFAWNQTYYSINASCDIIALDNITVALSYEGRTRQVYRQFFDSGDDPPGWKLDNVTLTNNSTECDSNYSNYCLFYTGGKNFKGVDTRQAKSPLLDLSIVSPVVLTTPPSTNQLVCNTTMEKL